jgi:enediyne biosynthesis protein E4
MKTKTGLLFFLFPFLVQAQGPLFEQVSSGPHVNAPSDSRSVNFADLNGDGWDDLFISNGPQSGALNFLYLNNGAGQLQSASGGDIALHAKPFDGASFADYDNDGAIDLFVVTWYGVKNYLYKGNGDGTFSYVSGAAPSIPATYSETASWGDYDLDGDVDLYVSNSDGNKKNLLYRNDGGGVFTKITSGPAANDLYTSRSVNWVDYNNDTWPDLFVANENNEPNNLYRNLGNGAFEAVANAAQTEVSSLSSSWGDVDNDGDLDLFVGNSDFFSPALNQLFLNENGVLTAVTTGDLITDGGCSFGSAFGDYDNDGDLDLVVSNGFCAGNILNFLYKNNGSGVFTRDLSSIANLSTPCSYGAAWGDVNNDGFLDLAIATCKNGGSTPLANNLFYLNNGNGNNWLKIRLQGTQSNHSAIGARVWVTALVNGQSVTQMREISAQSGHCGQNSLTAHFGLADATEVTQLRIHFAGGQDTTLTQVAANQILTLVEGGAVSGAYTPADAGFSVRVFPNPSADSFQVQVHCQQAATKLQLRLSDATGNVLWSEEVEGISGLYRRQLSKKALGLGTGVYFLTVAAGGQVRTVVVE